MELENHSIAVFQIQKSVIYLCPSLGKYNNIIEN